MNMIQISFHLKKIARKVWRGITSAYLVILYQSIPRHMQAVIDGQGGHIKYWRVDLNFY